MPSRILCLDFDGVCHSYTSGWKGPGVIPDAPVPGLFEFITTAQQHFDVQVYSSRSSATEGVEGMKKWFLKHFDEWQQKTGYVGILKLKYPTNKPPATVSLDDRALTFTGTWPSIQTLKDFKPWNK